MPALGDSHRHAHLRHIGSRDSDEAKNNCIAIQNTFPEKCRLVSNWIRKDGLEDEALPLTDQFASERVRKRREGALAIEEIPALSPIQKQAEKSEDAVWIRMAEDLLAQKRSSRGSEDAMASSGGMEVVPEQPGIGIYCELTLCRAGDVYQAEGRRQSHNAVK